MRRQILEITSYVHDNYGQSLKHHAGK